MLHTHLMRNTCNTRENVAMSVNIEARKKIQEREKFVFRELMLSFLL